MGYYIRVLGISNPDIHLDELKASLTKEGLQASFEIDEAETPDNWSTFTLVNVKGDPIMQVERNLVLEGELGFDELEEFREEIEEYEPLSAAKWLKDYFDNIKVIYAFQLLHDSTTDENYPLVNEVRSAIWNKTGGIMQADGEGFSNEEGYHILWQFDDEVAGDWECAVLIDGSWQKFSMDLGDPVQRKEYLAGKVPANAIRR